MSIDAIICLSMQEEIADKNELLQFLSYFGCCVTEKHCGWQGQYGKLGCCCKHLPEHN
jgi:hypothetical protein